MYESRNQLTEALAKRLNGLFIWAIDQDALDNKLLNAVLYPDGLGKFRDQNGAGNDGSQWETQPLTYCQWSGKTNITPFTSHYFGNPG